MTTKTKTTSKPKAKDTVEPSDLLAKAMLVRFSVHGWAAKVNDRKISKEVAEQHKNEETMGRYIKSLLKSEHLDAYNQVGREAYTVHRTMTLPWDDGTGLLPSANFWKYNERMEELKRKADEHASAFVKEYEAQWNNGMAKFQELLGDLFDKDDYPHPERLKQRFGIRVRVRPLTNPNDFRVQLG